MHSVHESYISNTPVTHFSLTLSDMSPADMLSVSSQLDEVCARVLVRIGDQSGVKTEHF